MKRIDSYFPRTAQPAAPHAPPVAGVALTPPQPPQLPAAASVAALSPVITAAGDQMRVRARVEVDGSAEVETTPLAFLGTHADTEISDSSEDGIPLVTPKRKSGVPFELHVAKELMALASGSSGSTLRVDPELARALEGAIVHGRWADVPARLLVEIGWEPRDPHERRKLYEGPKEQRGWREYGGDWLAERGDVPGALLIGQDKNHSRLTLGCLGTFITVADDVYEHNHQTLGLPSGTPSAVLCFPMESRISQRDHVHMCKMQRRRGLHLLGFLGFAPRPGLDPEADPMEEDDEVLVPIAPAVARPASPPLVGTSTATPSIEEAPMDVGEEEEAEEAVAVSGEPAAQSDAEATVYALAKPRGGQDRAFQTKAIRSICSLTNSVSLVKAPPGCGKTAIVAAVVGRLVTKVHAMSTRSECAEAAKPRIAFLTAPFIDHAKQLVDRLEGVLSNTFGKHWRRDVVEFVGDDNLPTIAELKAKLAADKVRVFVSTDKSAWLLHRLAVHARGRGHPMLCVKDEAHFNSDHESDSTELLTLAGEQADGYAVACTATPDGDVMDLPSLHVALDFSLQEAVDRGFCAPYEVVLPFITELGGDDDDLPVEARDLAKRHKLGAAALFGVGGMLRDGKRRCIAYARDKAEALALKGFLEEACAFHGADCVARVVTEEVADRKALYDDFQDGSTHTRQFRDKGELDLVKPTLRFLIGVQILDQCVDLPATDSVLLASPPTSRGDVKSAHRAIQRLGRGTRPKPGNRGCAVYVFTDHDNEWLHQLFDVLAEFDPGCKGRVRVASSNPVAAFSNSTTTLEHTSLETLRATYKIGSVACSPQEWVGIKVRALTAKFADARPSRNVVIELTSTDVDTEGKRLLPDGIAAYDYKAGCFLDNVILNFVPNGKPNNKLMPEQMEHMRATLPWLDAAIDSASTSTENNAASKGVDVAVKVRALVARCADARPSRNVVIELTSTDVDTEGKRLQPDGIAAYDYKAGCFLSSVLSNFVSGGKPNTKLLPEQMEYMRDNLTWLDAAIDAHSASSEKKAASKDVDVVVKVRALVAKCADTQPLQTVVIQLTSSDIDIDEKRLLPDGLDAYGFRVGSFLNHVLPNFVPGGKRHTTLLPEQMEYMRAALPWLQGAIDARIAAGEKTAASKGVDVAMKVRALVAKCVDARPSQKVAIELTSTDVDLEGKRLLPDDTASYDFNAGLFLNNILPNFMPNGKPNTTLTSAQMEYMHANLSWLQDAIDARIVAGEKTDGKKRKAVSTSGDVKRGGKLRKSSASSDDEC